MSLCREDIGVKEQPRNTPKAPFREITLAELVVDESSFRLGSPEFGSLLEYPKEGDMSRPASG